MDTRHSPDVSCEQFEMLVDDFVDGRLDDADRVRVSRHLEGCAACRALADDLKTIKQTASTLPRHAPRPDVWNQIARNLKAGMPAQAPAAKAAFWSGWRVALAAAAVVVLAVATVVVLRAPTPTLPGAASAPTSTQGAANPVHQSTNDVVQEVDEHLRIADANYQQAIAALEKVVAADQTALDPALAATLHKNMGIIDKAVSESRAAIKSQPNSQLAQTSLFEALRQKVALLEDTIALINVMRKGDQAGAAKIIGGQSKS